MGGGVLTTGEAALTGSALEVLFREVAGDLCAAWGSGVEETGCQRWELPGGTVRLILWSVYGFVELAAFRAGAQESWFLSRPGDAFIARHGTKPVVSIGRARTRAAAWLRGEALDEADEGVPAARAGGESKGEE